MSVSAEMYIVISLMFAVFAAVAAIGTSIVLGAGFERLRAGFEVIKKQTGFFADAIHKLDERTKVLDEQAGTLKESVSNISVRVDRVEKQTDFFGEAIETMGKNILQGSPVDRKPQKISVHPIKKQPVRPSSPFQNMDWGVTSETGRLLKERQVPKAQLSTSQDAVESKGISNILVDYFRGESHMGSGKEIVFH